MDRRESITDRGAACVEASSTPACEVVDLTQNSSPEDGGTKPTAATGKRVSKNTNIVDLTEIDNPCYDATAIEEPALKKQRLLNPGANTKDRTLDTITWENVYPKLPNSIQQQFDKPKLGSSKDTQKLSETPANASTTDNLDEEEDEYADDVLDKEAALLIEMTDRVSSQVSSTATDSRSSTTAESEPCPVCEKGKRVRATFSAARGLQTGYKCTYKDCWYEELDY